MGHVRVVIGPLCANSEITTFLSFFSLNKYHSISIWNVREAFVFFFGGEGLGSHSMVGLYFELCSHSGLRVLLMGYYYSHYQKCYYSH